METPLSLRLLELGPKLEKRSKQSGMSKADLVRLATFELLQRHKTTESLYQAQAAFKTRVGT